MIGSPKRPRLNEQGRSGWPLTLRSATQKIEIKYEASSDPRPRDRIWLKATVEPMLTKENRIEKAAVNRIAKYQSVTGHVQYLLCATYHS